MAVDMVKLLKGRKKQHGVISVYHTEPKNENDLGSFAHIRSCFLSAVVSDHTNTISLDHAIDEL